MSRGYCATHNLEFVYIPDGISKRTGRPYAGFWVCPFKGCKEKPLDDQSASSPIKTQEEAPGSVHPTQFGTPELKRVLKDALEWDRRELLVEIDKRLNDLRLEFTKKIAEGMGDNLGAKLDNLEWAIKQVLANSEKISDAENERISKHVS